VQHEHFTQATSQSVSSPRLGQQVDDPAGNLTFACQEYPNPEFLNGGVFDNYGMLQTHTQNIGGYAAFRNFGTFRNRKFARVLCHYNG
jgi:hypothetical protein